MKNIEIPLQSEKDWKYRLFEILPGFLSWSILALPFVLSLINTRITVVFIVCYFIIWFMRAIGLNVRIIQGYRTMKLHEKLPWNSLLEELEHGKLEDPQTKRPKWHYSNLKRYSEQPLLVKPSEVIHAIIVPSYNESRGIIEPTLQALLSSDYDMKKVILIMAYEGRDGAQSEAAVLELIKFYEPKFKHAFATKHPLTPGEVRGKGGNATFAARQLQKYLKEHNIDPLEVIVTTLDADHRVHPKYLSAVTYPYCIAPNPVHVSFQPIPMFTNNIWDAPAPMRVIATGNSFWMMVVAVRPHILRNFAAHSQSMQTLIDTDYWSVRTIVEDGHQFWRTYFRYDGQHDVHPIFVPVYQDAVFTDKYKKTLKAQFIQLRRWAWGASDVAYVAKTGFMTKNKVPKLDLIFKFFRLLEGHISWAVTPLLLAFAAFIPNLFNHQDIAANQLPLIASRIQTIAMLGIAETLFISFKTLPPKPDRYKRSRSLFMVLQWLYLPLTSIFYYSFSALTSQTRLMFGRYLDKFDVTEKAVADEKGIVT